MKRLFLSFAICVGAILTAVAQPTFSKHEFTINDFLPDHFPDIKGGSGEIKLNGKFNPNIPTPKDVLGFELGEFYLEWHAILNYVNTVAKVSDRVKVRTVEYTYEKRPIIEVAISSPKNIERLDAIREEHLKLSDASVSKSLDVSKMPVIVSHVNAIHGNEHSSASASLAVIYLYAASEDPTVLDILDNTVLLIVPSINPDGVNRFSSWCNGESSIGQRIADVNTNEYSLNQPGGPLSRCNHYWHDANRDLSLTQHPEGRAYTNISCGWMPDLMYDNHESSQLRGLFCSPGVLAQLHPLLPMEGQDHARYIGKYTTAILAKVGQNTYSDARYDDYYLGRGDVYGDIQGIVNILIEQTNSRGFFRPLDDGKSYPLTRSIRNHTYASAVSVFAAYQNREMLHNYQRNFFLRTAEMAKEAKTKGYIFNTRGDRALEYSVLEWMKHHRFDIYKLAKDTKVDGVIYSAKNSYIVPAEQRYFLKFKGLWENLTKFNADNFYDVSTWSLKHAFNVQECEVEKIDGLVGEKVEKFSFPEGKVCATSEHGYLVGANGLYSHNVLRAMLLKGVRVDIATKSFKANGKEYGCGTAYVALANQPLSATEIYNELEAAAKMNGVNVCGLKKPLQLKDFKTLTHLPRVAMVTGNGGKSGNEFESGEIWHLLDQRFGLTPARINIYRLHLVEDFNKYDVVIFPNSETITPISDAAYKNLKAFVEAGGTLIVTGDANDFLKNAGINAVTLKPVAAEQPKSEQIAGIIIKTDIDSNDPLGYGYESGVSLPIFKRGCRYIDTANSSYDKAVVVGATAPYLSGFVSQTNLDSIASTPIVVKKKVGKGSVIYSSENLTFRSYWFASMKLFINSIYFGNF